MKQFLLLLGLVFFLAGCDASASVGPQHVPPTPVPQVPVSVYNDAMANANQQIAAANARADASAEVSKEAQNQVAKMAEMNRPMTPEETQQRIITIGIFVVVVLAICSVVGFLVHRNRTLVKIAKANAKAQKAEVDKAQLALQAQQQQQFNQLFAGLLAGRVMPQLPPGQTFPAADSASKYGVQVRNPNLNRLEAPKRSTALTIWEEDGNG